MLVGKTKRPRNVDAARAAAILYGDWGTSKAYVIGLAFAIAGYSAQEVESRFGGMLNAFKFGAPPHGGSAPGIDRIVMLLADTPNLREIVAFPMNQQAQDLLMQAPSPVDDKQLRELHLQLSPKAKQLLAEETVSNNERVYKNTGS